jgi:hypothetical protein
MALKSPHPRRILPVLEHIPFKRHLMIHNDGLQMSMATGSTTLAKSKNTSAPYRVPVYIACTVLALTTNYLLGKDMAWDTLNYHLYLGFSALNDRFSQDYFAAGPLAYLNPFAYVPFYAMVRAGLPALVICSIFAIVHSIILWLTFDLGVAVSPSQDDRTRLLAGASAVALAFMNPILMQQIGSCFADITTAELALAGWLLLASAVRRPQVSRVIYAGLILGAASALKLSNALPAASAFAMLVMLPRGWPEKIRCGFFYGTSLGVGFVAVAAPWSYRLFKVFGNPLFPMFNSIVRSPQYTTDPTVVSRFVPESIGDALWRPFAMLNPTPMVHEELSAPDPRYAILVVLVILFIARWAWRRRGQASLLLNKSPLTDSSRVLAALGCALCLYWIIWLRTSGNSRYILTLACVAAAVIVGMLFRLFETRPKIRNYVLFVILATQAVQLYLGAEYRWNGAQWGGPWFNLSVPDRLKTEPNLYLTLGGQSNSFIAPFLAKDSSFVNVAGGYTLDPESANGAHVKALIRRFSPNVRVVFHAGTQYKNAELRAPPAPEVDDAIQRFALRADMRQCATITVHGLPAEPEIRYVNSSFLEPQNRDETYLVTCRLVADTRDFSAIIARQRAVDIVFDRLEDACPRLFSPRRMLSLHEGDIWRRLYGGSDIAAWINRGRVKIQNLMRPTGIIDVGAESDWAKGSVRLECGSHNGVYFVHVLPSNL